jgi:hypothetical protein
VTQDRITFEDTNDASQVRQTAAVRGDVGDDSRPQEAQGIGQEADAGQGGEGVSSQVDTTIEIVVWQLKEIEANKVALLRARAEHEAGARRIDKMLGDLRSRHTEKSQQLLGLIEMEGEQLANARRDRQSDER